METAHKARYGLLAGVPAGYSGTCGLVMQADIVIETRPVLFKAYQAPWANK